MIIRRLRVEEGFFDGLDLEFSKGLNVLIGGRGVGKTSVVELIRYCLRVPGITNETDMASLSHALAVLGPGQISLELEIGGEVVTVMRSSNDDRPRASGSYESPIIFSQTEIENVGLDSRGRMGLLDNFDLGLPDIDSEKREIEATVRSISSDMTRLRQELEELEIQTKELPKLLDSEKSLVAQQKQNSSTTKEAVSAAQELEKLQSKINDLSIGDDALRTFKERLGIWKTNLESLLGNVPILRGWPKSLAKSELHNIAKSLISDTSIIEKLINNSHNYIKLANEESRVLVKSRLPLDEHARELRKIVDKHKEGAGKLAREVGKIREVIAKLKNRNVIRNEKQMLISKQYEQRSELLHRLSELRKSVFVARQRTVKRLNDVLSPTIHLEVVHLAILIAYEESLRDTLRGSGLKYNEISSIIASNISPEELAEITFLNKYEQMAEILEISQDRAARLTGYLREADLGHILTSPIFDDVKLSLMDGGSYKLVDELSIGQRCTIALSIVLENMEKVLIVDQPEDHLDNEFIVDTLIRAISARKKSAQTIVSSHNANIPVLGNADRVIQLDSNGRRGFIANTGKLDSHSIVSAITKIMEGGKEAFEKRAKFYGTN